MEVKNIHKLNCDANSRKPSTRLYKSRKHLRFVPFAKMILFLAGFVCLLATRLNKPCADFDEIFRNCPKWVKEQLARFRGWSWSLYPIQKMFPSSTLPLTFSFLPSIFPHNNVCYSRMLINLQSRCCRSHWDRHQVEHGGLRVPDVHCCHIWIAKVENKQM